EQPLLPEREPARVHLRRRVLRIEEVRAVVETARIPLVARRLEGRRLVEPEPLRVLEDRGGADLLADVAEDRVDGVLERGREVEVPERLAAALVRVARIRDLLAVFGAVAGIVEAGRRRERAGVERGGRGDDLEGRARRVEPLRRAVVQRRRAGARAADLQHLRVTARL